MFGMAKPLPEDILELATDEIPALIDAVEGSPLSERHKAIILTLIQQTVDINRDQPREDGGAAQKSSVCWAPRPKRNRAPKSRRLPRLRGRGTDDTALMTTRPPPWSNMLIT